MFLVLSSSRTTHLFYFITRLVPPDGAEIVLFPVLETRWEHLHAGRGVTFSGQGSDMLYDTTGLEGRGQTGWISDAS